MGKKIAFIGAGSFGFTRGLVRDILSFPAFRDATLALMDIDAEKLGFVRTAVEQIVEAGKYPAKIEATFDRPRSAERCRRGGHHDPAGRLSGLPHRH